MSRRLKHEIENVEQEINVLAQVKAHMEAGRSVQNIEAEMGVLSSVHQRLMAALPGEPKPRAEKRTRKPAGLPKPNGKQKEATQ